MSVADADIHEQLDRIEERLTPPDVDIRGALDLVQDLQAELDDSEREL